MKLNRRDFASALKAVSGCAKKSQIKETEGILLTHSIGGLDVSAYDLTMGAEVTLPGSIAEDFTVLVPSLIVHAVEKMQSDEIELEVGEGKITIKDGRSQYQLATMCADNYPKLPDIGDAVSIDVGDLKSLVRQVSYCAAKDIGRPERQCVMLEVENDTLSAVACDGFRMAVATAPVKGDGISALIPAEALDRINADGDCVLYIGKTHAMIESGNVRNIIRLVTGDFVKYKNLIRESSKINVTVKTSELADAVARVKIVSDAAKKLATLQCEIKDKWSVSTQTTLGAASDTCACDTDGEIKFAVNPNYLLDMLKYCGCDELNIGISAPTQAIMVQGGNVTAILMPVRYEQ